MDGPVDMEQRRYELLRYQTHYKTFMLDHTPDHDLGISSSKYYVAMLQELMGPIQSISLF